MADNLITAIADASVDADRRWYGWAAWARNSNDFFEDCGHGDMPAGGTVAYAELIALREAVKQAVKAAAGLPSVLVLQSDCVDALWVLMEHGAQVSRKKTDAKIDGRHCGGKMSASMRALGKETMDLATAHFSMVWLKHVKGHTSREGGRYSINDRLDRMAKVQMRARRDGVSA